ncbi:MAG: hypothetical protein ACREM3_00785 [Candidatus Rokuibacteriota bacterium]
MLAELVLFLVLNVKILEILGGSITFLFASGVLLALGEVRRIYPHMMVDLAILGTILMGANALAYLESAELLSQVLVLVMAMAVALLFSIVVLRMYLDSSRRRNTSETEPGGRVDEEMVGTIAPLSSIVPFSLVSVFVGGLAVLIGRRSRLVEGHWITVTLSAIIGLVIAVVVATNMLRLVRARAGSGRGLNSSEPPLRRRYILVALVVMLAMSVMAEIVRGRYGLNVATFLLWVVTLANSPAGHGAIAVGRLSDGPPVDALADLAVDLKPYLFASMIVAAYALGLAVLLALTTPT